MAKIKPVIPQVALHPGHYFLRDFLQMVNIHLDQLETAQAHCGPLTEPVIALQYQFWDGFRMFLLNEGDFEPTPEAVETILRIARDLKTTRKVDNQGRKINWKADPTENVGMNAVMKEEEPD